MNKKINNLLKTQFYRIIYRVNPSNTIWVFSSTNNEKFNYNSKYLFEYVIENENNIKPYFVINDDKERVRLQQEYGEEYFIETKSRAGIKKVLSGGVWFTSAGLPLYGIKLNKNRTIVNLWHGIPVKRIALMENNYNPLKKLYFKKIFSQNYSYILTTSKELIPIMKESFGVKEEIIKVWGQPRNDVLFKSVEKNKIEELFSDLPKYKKLVLYAPTYRDEDETKLFPFDDYDKEKLNDFLQENNAIIFIRTHISESANIEKYLSNRVILLNENIIEDIMEVLNIFDILITDYSSIYIDYLLLQRPLIFLPYDKEEYLNKRGMNFEYEQITPGTKPESLVELMDALKKSFNGEDIYTEKRREINDFFNEIKELCSENICSYIKSIIEE